MSVGRTDCHGLCAQLVCFTRYLGTLPLERLDVGSRLDRYRNLLTSRLKQNVVARQDFVITRRHLHLLGTVENN